MDSAPEEEGGPDCAPDEAALEYASTAAEGLHFSEHARGAGGFVKDGAGAYLDNGYVYGGGAYGSRMGGGRRNIVEGSVVSVVDQGRGWVQVTTDGPREKSDGEVITGATSTNQVNVIQL